jgi:hypothetical protein
MMLSVFARSLLLVLLLLLVVLLLLVLLLLVLLLVLLLLLPSWARDSATMSTSVGRAHSLDSDGILQIEKAVMTRKL